MPNTQDGQMIIPPAVASALAAHSAAEVLAWMGVGVAAPALLPAGATPVVTAVIDRYGCHFAKVAVADWSVKGLAKVDQPRPCPTCDLARALIEGVPV